MADRRLNYSTIWENNLQVRVVVYRMSHRLWVSYQYVVLFLPQPEPMGPPIKGGSESGISYHSQSSLTECSLSAPVTWDSSGSEA